MSAPTSGALQSIFRFLVFLCLSAVPRQTYFFTFGSLLPSGLQFRTLLHRHQPCAMHVRPFYYFRETVITCGYPYFFSPFSFVRCSFGVSNDFVCGLFTWIEVSYLWYSFTNAIFRFLLSFGLRCRSGLHLSF